MYKPAIIVDMDGTLSDCSHRLHFVNTKPRNYDAFEAGCHADPVNEAVATVVNAMSLAANILIVSARMDGRKHLTVDWLDRNNIPYDGLYMRKQDDSRKDDVVKREILDKIREEGYTVLFAIEDRKRVKQMWVENGVFVFDVNQKDKEY